MREGGSSGGEGPGLIMACDTLNARDAFVPKIRDSQKQMHLKVRPFYGPPQDIFLTYFIIPEGLKPQKRSHALAEVICEMSNAR